MVTDNRLLRKELLNWESIRTMDSTNVIMVNSNRLYWQLAELKRANDNRKGITILKSRIEEIHDEKQMYIPMNVGDVIVCFEKNNKLLPINTFRANRGEHKKLNSSGHKAKVPNPDKQPPIRF